MKHEWKYLGNDAYCINCGAEKDPITEAEACEGKIDAQPMSNESGEIHGS